MPIFLKKRYSNRGERQTMRDREYKEGEKTKLRQSQIKEKEDEN